MRRILLYLATALAVAGCATTQVAPEKAAAIKTVGLVSALGDEVRLQHVGLTVFSNSVTTATFDWGLDGHMEAGLTKLLGQRYQVRPVAYDRPKLLAAAKGQSVGPDRPTIEQVLRAAVTPGDIDALVVILPTYMSDGAYRTNQVVFGVGVLTRGMFSERTSGHAYTAYRIVVADARSFAILAEAGTWIPSSDSWTGQALPFRPFPGGAFRETLEQTYPTDLANLRTTIVDLLDTSAAYTVRKMKLLD